MTTRNQGLIKIISHFEKSGYDFSNKRAVDFFAREGDWQTSILADKVCEITAFEIEEKYLNSLKKNLPNNAIIRIKDSIKSICEVKQNYDIIILDNPMGCFGESGEYCEHFDIIEKTFNIMNSKCLLIFNVKTKPYNFNNNEKWKKRRNNFYGVSDSSNLSIEFFKDFYFNMIKENKRNIDGYLIVNRPQESHLFQMSFLISS